MALSKHDLEVAERLATLETTLQEHVEDEEKQLVGLAAKMDRIELELSRYRGTVGGILLTITAVGTFLKMFGEQIMGFFSR